MVSSRELRIATLERELAALRAEATTTTTTTTTRMPWGSGPTPRSPAETLLFLNAMLRALQANREREAEKCATELRKEIAFAHQATIDRMVDRIFGAIRERKGEGQGDKGNGKIAFRVASSGGGGGDGPQSKKRPKK